MEFSKFARLGCLWLAALGLSACATSGDAISKVKIFKLNAGERVQAADPAIVFEQKHHLHGAVTAEEMQEREGNYYTVFWTVADRTRPVTVRFEYLQAATGPKVLSIDQEVAAPGRANTTRFEITGPAFAQGGRVLAWRVLLLRGRETLATRESYLWK